MLHRGWLTTVATLALMACGDRNEPNQPPAGRELPLVTVNGRRIPARVLSTSSTDQTGLDESTGTFELHFARP